MVLLWTLNLPAMAVQIRLGAFPFGNKKQEQILRGGINRPPACKAGVITTRPTKRCSKLPLSLLIKILEESGAMGTGSSKDSRRQGSNQLSLAGSGCSTAKLQWLSIVAHLRRSGSVPERSWGNFTQKDRFTQYSLVRFEWPRRP